MKHNLNSKKLLVGFGFLAVYSFMAWLLREYLTILVALFGASSPIAGALIGFQAWIDRNGVKS